MQKCSKRVAVSVAAVLLCSEAMDMAYDHSTCAWFLSFIKHRATATANTTVHYPHMPIGKVWIYRLLLLILFVCTVTDFSVEQKARGIKFSTVVHRHPGQGISHSGELCAPISPKSAGLL